MARLIDGVVQEAQALGIETMTPGELALLKDEWQ
jgi:ethanolamine utilization microcompartment shell protein EutS